MIDVTERTVVGKLRLTARGARVEPALFQLRLSNVLSSADLRPPSLPRSGIACIRRVADPLPGKLSDVRGGEALPRAWETAAVAAIDRLVRGAARPAHGEVSTTAEAVVFADEAELLACLAHDWCAGLTATRWWWPDLFGGNILPRAAIAAWLQAPRFVPSALRRLAAGGTAVRFVQAFSAEEADVLLREITVHFALDELRAVLDAPSDGLRSAPPPELRVPPKARAAVGGSVAVRASRGPGPWYAWVPETQTSGLNPEHQALLGVALMLHRAPAHVRSTSFAASVHAWLRIHAPSSTTRAVASTASPQRWRPASPPARQAAQSSSPRPAVDDALDLGGGPPAGSTQEAVPVRPELDTAATRSTRTENAPTPTPPARAPGPNRRALSIGVTKPIDRPAPTAPSRTAAARFTAASMTPPLVARLLAPETLPAHGRPGPGRAASPADELVGTPPERSVEPAPQGEQLPNIAEAVELELQTRLGGLFFLLNLALYLGLYGDFTSPEQPGLPLPIWDFLRLLGKRLVYPERELHGDPIWSLLARLAGTERARMPGEWRMPVDWLTPYPEAGTWSWSSFGKRLRVWHPAGFHVLDVPLVDADPVRALLSETYPYRRVSSFGFKAAVLRGVVDHACWLVGTVARSDAERWMRWLAPYVRSRLTRAVGRGAANLVCKQAARVVLTETRLDAYFALDTLPIEVRLAGLDRDPGWLPAAGRSVAFHFAGVEQT